MSIFEYQDYKRFVREHLKTFPQKGRGQFLKIAKLLHVHTTMVTHIFKGDSNLSVEQGLVLAGYFGLSELETDYFVHLIQLERAANPQSRQYFKSHLEKVRQRALNLSERIRVKSELDEKAQLQFYSSWVYSGVRLLVATGEYRSIEDLTQATALPRGLVAKVVEFLLSNGLLRMSRDRFEVGDTTTYVSRESPHVRNHHLNWRLRAIEQLTVIPEEELVFTNSIAVSAKDFMRIREELVLFLEKFRAIADPSPAEQVCFLNLDWRKLQFPERG